MKTFRNILFLLLLFCGSTLYLPAAGPLKKPLHFVPSDSVIVWGGDRSDIRATALAASPSLKCRETTLSPADMAQAKHTIKSWEKDILPELNPLGGLGEAYDDSRVLELSKMLTLGGKLFLLTADAQYMNVVERASLNALLHMLRPGDMNFEKHTAAQALINASGMFYAYDDEGVFVNLYVNSSTHIKTDHHDLVIDQLTSMPHEPRVKLRISGLSKGQHPLKVALRIPDWAMGGLPKEMPFLLEGVPAHMPTIYVNGREETYQMENGYLVIRRKWNSGDEIFFDFPFSTTALRPSRNGKAKGTALTLQRGPLVYGFRQPASDCILPEGQHFKEQEEPSEEGHSIVAATCHNADGSQVLLKAEPVMDGTEYLWLKCEK